MVKDPETVLLVEDDLDIRDLIELHLRREGFSVVSFDDGKQAIQFLESQQGTKISLAILDWMLPEVSGVEIVKIIRSSKSLQNLPILMVTAKSEPQDVVLGLEKGADDYVTKPFEASILLARVKALLRRGQRQSENKKETHFSIEGLVIETVKHEVFCQGEKIHLTISEFKLLQAMMQNQGKVLTRDQLISLVQGEGVSVIDRTIDTHIFGLRKKLGHCSEVIETIRGVGYRIKG